MVHNHYIYNDTPRLKIFIVGQKYFKPLPAAASRSHRRSRSCHPATCLQIPAAEEKLFTTFIRLPGIVIVTGGL